MTDIIILYLIGHLQVGLGWNFGSLETTSKPSGENYLEDEGDEDGDNNHFFLKTMQHVYAGEPPSNKSTEQHGPRVWTARLQTRYLTGKSLILHCQFVILIINVTLMLEYRQTISFQLC